MSKSSKKSKVVDPAAKAMRYAARLAKNPLSLIRRRDWRNDQKVVSDE